MFDEAVQRSLGLGRCDREQPRSVVAHHERKFHAVEVVADLLVDVVFARLVWLWNLQRRLLFRRRLPIFFVVVPSVADWFVAVHEYVEAPALFAIEVLHAEPAAIAGPFGEVLAGEREGGRGQDVGDETVRAQAVDELLGGVRSRLVDEYGAAVLLECVGVCLGLHQGGPGRRDRDARDGAPRGRGAASGGGMADAAGLRWLRRGSPRGGSARRRTWPGPTDRRRATAGCCLVRSRHRCTHWLRLGL